MLKEIGRCLYACACLWVGAQAGAQEISQGSGGGEAVVAVRFERAFGAYAAALSAVSRVAKTYASGRREVEQYSDAAGDFLYGVAATGRPLDGVGKGLPGKTQWLSFLFKSEGLFTANPCAHLAIAGRWEGMAFYNRGRGVTIGDAGNPWPCNTATGWASVQGEIWFNPATNAQHAANRMSQEKFQDVLQDHREYLFAMRIADDGYVYWITDAMTQAVRVVRYEYVPDDGSADWYVNRFFAQGFAMALLNARMPPFSFTAWNFDAGWF